jgi:hypothetical protein
VASNACVELAADGEWVAVRNSRDTAVALKFTHAEIRAVVDGAKKGEFDHLIEQEN